MKNRAGCGIAVLLALCCLLFPLKSRADFGDYGGGDDYGGYDYGDYDYDDDDYEYEYDYDDDDDDDYDYDYDRGSGASGGHASDAFSVGLLIALAVGAVLLFAIGFRKKPRKPIVPKYPGAPGEAPADPDRLMPIADYRKLNPGFSPEAFKERLSDRFLQIGKALRENDPEAVRAYLSEELCARLLAACGAGQTDSILPAAVLSVRLTGWKQKPEGDEILARIRFRSQSGKPAEAALTLRRIPGKTAKQPSAAATKNCPHCGAALNGNRKVRCAYCGSVLSAEPFGWVITDALLLPEEQKSIN